MHCDEISTGDELVGRDEEIDQLNSYLDAVHRTGGQTIFISGEPGIGKTALIKEIKKSALEKGFDILEGGCTYGVSEPYIPFQKAWYESKNESLPSVEQMKEQNDLDVKSESMLKGQRKAAFYETMMELRNESKNTPHLIIIEDLHLADQSTLNLFHFLAERLDDSPVIFIGTYDPGDAVPGNPFLEMKYHLSRKGLYSELELDKLDKDETRRLATNILDTEDMQKEFLDSLYQKTDGIPLLIKEGLIHLRETNKISIEDYKSLDFDEELPVPDHIEEVVNRRIFRLEDEARSILQIGGVIGEVIPFDLLTKVSEYDELKVLDHIDDLIRNRLWTENNDDETLRFSHPKIRDVIYSGIGDWVEKQKLHYEIAEGIKDLYQDKIEDMSITLAEHYTKAEKYSLALEHYIKSAKNAEEVYAFEDAIKIYQRSLNIIHHLPKKDKTAILKRIAKAYRILGEYDESKKIQFEILNDISDPKEKQKIYIQIVKTLQNKGKFEEVLDLIDERLSLEKEDTLERGELLCRKGWSLLKIGNLDKAEKTFEEEVRLAEDLNEDEFMAQAYHDIGSFYMAVHSYEKGVSFLEKAKNIREEMGDIRGLANTINSLSGYNVMRGNLDKALEELQNCLDLYEVMEDTLHMSTIHNNIGYCYRKKGELDKALDHFTKAYRFSEMIENKFKKGERAINIGVIYMLKGSIDDAISYLEEGRRISEETGNLDNKIEADFYLGKIELEKGDLEKAEEYLKNLIESTSSRDLEKDKATVDHLRGDIYRKKERYEDSSECLSEAVDLYEKANLPDQEAYARYELGLALKKKGDIKNAFDAIEKSKIYFKKRGMDLWKNKCEKALEELSRE